MKIATSSRVGVVKNYDGDDDDDDGGGGGGEEKRQLIKRRRSQHVLGND
jgi:hypothetical protein